MSSNSGRQAPIWQLTGLRQTMVGTVTGGSNLSTLTRKQEFQCQLDTLRETCGSHFFRRHLGNIISSTSAKCCWPGALRKFRLTMDKKPLRIVRSIDTAESHFSSRRNEKPSHLLRGPQCANSYPYSKVTADSEASATVHMSYTSMEEHIRQSCPQALEE